MLLPAGALAATTAVSAAVSAGILGRSRAVAAVAWVATGRGRAVAAVAALVAAARRRWRKEPRRATAVMSPLDVRAAHRLVVPLPLS